MSDKFEVQEYTGKAIASYMIFGADYDRHKAIYMRTRIERVSGVKRPFTRMQFFDFDSSQVVIVNVAFRDWNDLHPASRDFFYRHHVVKLFELRGLLYAPIRVDE